MLRAEEARRVNPVFADPADKDQGRVNLQITDAQKLLFRLLISERQRADRLEKRVRELEHIVNG